MGSCAKLLMFVVAIAMTGEAAAQGRGMPDGFGTYETACTGPCTNRG